MKAGKFSEKFNVFRLKHFMLEVGRVMNASLQVKTASIHKLLALDHELQNRDHFTLIDLLPSILF